MNTTGDKNALPAIFALAFCSFANLGCSAAQRENTPAQSSCLSYSTTATTLRGEISASKIALSHNAGVNHSRYNAFHLHLVDPICVNRGQVDDGLEPHVDRVEAIELGAVTAGEYRALQAMVGRIAQCTGSIVPPLTGYHLAEIILLSPICVPEGSP